MRHALILTAALLAAGCQRSAPADEPPPPPPPPPPKPAALKALFPAGPVATPGPFRGVRPGQPWPAAVKLAPSLARDRALVDPAWPGLRFVVDHAHGRVVRLSVELPPGSLAPLTAAWGAPAPGQDPLGRPMDVWWAPASGLRATLTAEFAGRRNLVFEAYQPARQALARVNGRFGFEAQLSLLGADQASVAAAFGGAWRGPDAPLALPPTEHGAGPVSVTLSWARGRVHAFTVALDHDRHAPAAEALQAALGLGRGAPTTQGAAQVWADPDRRVEALADPTTRSLTIQVSGPPDATATRHEKAR